MNLVGLLHEQVLRSPQVPALVEGAGRRRRVVTYAELARRVGASARVLGAAGLNPGDRVLILQPMSVALYVVLLAVFHSGLVAVFVDIAAGGALLGEACRRLRPRAFIGSPRAHLMRLRYGALNRIPYHFSTAGWVPGTRRLAGGADSGARTPPQQCGEDTPALITFTSGSTGMPKAAVRTHGFLLAQHKVLAECLALAPGERDLATLPIFVLSNLAAGVTTVIPATDLRRPGAVDPRPLLDQIQAEGVTRIAASPALLSRLVEGDECGAGGRLAGLRRIDTGGAPVFPPMLESLRAAAPRAAISAVYGSTEAEPIAHLGAGEISAADLAAMRRGAGLLAGRPVDAVALRIVPNRWGTPMDEMDGAAFAGLCLPPGEAGEIVVTGRHVLGGYLDGTGDEETKFQVDATRWHRTGDAGYLDQRGRLWLLGRAGARILDDRGELYPFTVECALSFDPRIRRSALVSRNGRRLLVVEPVPGARLEADEVMGQVDWACLDEIRMVKAIPLDRRHNAKVDYPALRRMLGAR